MPTDHGTLRFALPGIVLSLLLVGCGGDTTSSGAGSTSSPSTAVTSTSSPAAPDSPAAPQETTGIPSASGSATGNDGSDDNTPGDSGDSGDSGAASGDDTSQNGDGAGAGDGSGAGAGLEMPEAPEQTAESLSELLEDMRTTPLVTAPLPRAASARGRLVTRFPQALRPTGATRVETSSISPSGDRLQVALVASTSLAPADVLLAYRTRLAGRGLVEQAAPPATAGSQAAAFRRGRSTVTVSVTPQGSGTSYSVLASLHTGGE